MNFREASLCSDQKHGDKIISSLCLLQMLNTVSAKIDINEVCVLGTPDLLNHLSQALAVCHAINPLDPYYLKRRPWSSLWEN
jgi:hypothetical protein